MSIAALYDIHGNLPALEAVLRDVRAAGVDRIVVGGDVVPGPMPRECLERLLTLDIPVEFIRGNGERETLAVMRGEVPHTVPEQFRELIFWTAEQLDSDHERLLSALPATTQITVDGIGDVHFCHATPHNDTDIFTRLTPEHHLVPVFKCVDARIMVCGHTHMPFDRAVGTRRIVNAGSVGMPFGEPGAYWLMLGHSGIEFMRTSYDLAQAAERIRGTAYPHARDFAASVLEPPAEATMLEAFEPSRAPLRSGALS